VPSHVRITLAHVRFLCRVSAVADVENIAESSYSFSVAIFCTINASRSDESCFFRTKGAA